MRGTFGFDAAEGDYGAATAGVQQILSEWTAIDWFTPPELAAEITAMQRFVAHHRRGRAHAPDLFPADLVVRTVQGGWAEFADLCARVRAPSGWDWKFTMLKPLSSQHSKAHGWSLQEQAPDVGPGGDGKGAGPGALFFRVGDVTIWNNLVPKLDLASVLAPGFADVAGWYVSYAVMDLMECLEWQLAEKSADLRGNPFLPLLRCYGAGFCPFGLGPSEALLFGFKGDG